MPKKRITNEPINVYEVMPASLKPIYRNVGSEMSGLSHVFRIILCGMSGSMKSNTAINLISRTSGTFDHITLCCANSHEPLYEFLKSKLDDDQLSIYEGIKNIPPLDDFDKDQQHLIIFDDLVCEKWSDQKVIIEYFIRSRKIAKGCSLMYITQSYYGVPKIIRLNCTNIIMKQLTSMNDLNLVMRDFNLGIDKKKILEIYRECTKDKKDFLHIRIEAKPEERYAKNFTEVIPVKLDD